VGLVLVSPALASGAFLTPRVVAVTHLFTLGWITTSIMGALYQFLPVALGVAVRSERVAYGTFAVYAPGVAVFVGAMGGAHVDAMLVGAVAVAAGLLLFVGNLTATLARAAHRDVTWWALTLADVFLFLTLLLGLLLAGNLRWGYIGAKRVIGVGTHLHIALVGWVLMVIVGVAHRLLPMFLLSHGADERAGRAAVALLGTGVTALAALHHTHLAARKWLPAALILAGLAAFLAQARSFYRHRRKPVLDAGLKLAAGGLTLLGLAALLSVPVLVRGIGSPHLAATYVLLLILAISLFVAAHYYKIVPFLVWYHRFSSLIGRAEMPQVADLYSGRWAAGAGVLLLAGTLGLTASVAGGWAAGARAAALVFAAGTAVEAVQMAGLARRRP